MKSIIGLVEYTVTGGFFWIIFLVLPPLFGLAMGKPDAFGTFDVVAWLAQLSAPLAAGKDSFGVIFAGIVFIGVFATGLTLDLLAPVLLLAFEISWIRKWLVDRKEGWFAALVARHADLVGTHYEALIREGPRRWRPGVLDMPHYRALSTFVLTYALGAAKGGQGEEIFDRLKVWRVSRAISITLVILAISLQVASLVHITKLDSLRVFIVGAFVPWVLVLASWHMTRSSFFDLVQSMRASCFLAFTATSVGGAVIRPEPARATQRAKGKG